MATPSLQPFYRIVRLLKALPIEYQTMALHMALNWSDARLEEAIANGDLPGRPGELAELPPLPAMRLAVVDGRPLLDTAPAS